MKRPNDGLSVESRQALNTFRNLAVRTRVHRRADLVERRLLFSLPEATNRFVLRRSISAPSICVKLCELHLRVFLGIVSGRGSELHLVLR